MDQRCWSRSQLCASSQRLVGTEDPTEQARSRDSSEREVQLTPFSKCSDCVVGDDLVYLAADGVG